MSGKRRLPVIQSPKDAASSDEEESRPPWHWVGFGVVLIFAIWLPLAYVGSGVQARMLASRFGEGASKDEVEMAVAAMSGGERSRLMLSHAIPGVLALALASFAGGAVVARFGAGAGAGPREAALAGVVVATIATILAFQGATVATLASAVVTYGVAVGFSWWGGRVGRRSPAPR